MLFSFIKKPVLSFFFLLFCFGPSLVGQVFVHANSTCTSGCGASWADAYPDLQTALANTIEGEIWVGEGAYFPATCNPCTGEDRRTSFRLKNNIALYGGFSGTETSLSQRDPQQYPTILSGDIGTMGDRSDNSFHVVYAPGVDSTAILDGFVIENGQAEGEDPDLSDRNGGGILVDGRGVGNRSAPRILRCIIRNNTASNGGGGLYNDAGDGGEASPVVEDCTFENNRVAGFGRGGAVGHFASLVGRIGAEYRSCLFRNNRSVFDDGGAVAHVNTDFGTFSYPVYRNCRFETNEAFDRGGAYYSLTNEDAFHQAVLQNCLFLGNRADSLGGALFDRASFGGQSDSRIENCEFRGNIASDGGAVYLRGTQNGINRTVLVNGLFIQNQAFSHGGAFFTTAALRNGDFGDCAPSVVNCTFFHNTAFAGRAMYHEFSQPVLTNNILWDGGKEIVSDNAGPEIASCLIQGGYPGVNILDSDPLFLDTVTLDLRLSPCSPAVNAGNPLALPADIFDLDEDQDRLEPVDLDFSAAARVFEETVDLGAFEWQGIPTRLEGVTIQSRDADCNGGCTGSAAATPVGGEPGYAFSWSSGETSDSLFGLCGGVYVVTVTDAARCSVIDSATVVRFPPLKVDLGPDTTFCAGNILLILQARVDGGDGRYTYFWDDSLADLNFLLVSPGQDTIYSVAVTDGRGCITTDTIRVAVRPDSIRHRIGGELDFCPGGTTVLDAGSYAGYFWSTGDTTRTIVVDQAGVYGVQVITEEGCPAGSTVEVVENPIPVPAIARELTFCPGGEVELDAGVFSSYEWSTGDTTRIIVADREGAYEVTVRDFNSCEGRAVVDVRESDPADVRIDGNLRFCSGDSTRLDAGEYVSYEWSTGKRSRELVVRSPGQYGVTVVDAGGCTNSGSVEVVHLPGPEAVVRVAALEVCLGESLEVEVQGGEEYRWIDPSGFLRQISPGRARISPLQTTEFGAVAENSCGADTAYFEVAVLPLPEVDAGRDVSIANGASVQLMATGAEEYLWLVPAGLSCTSCPDPLARPEVTTVYVVRGTDTGGCMAEDSVTVTVIREAAQILETFNVITPNGDGVNDLFHVEGLEFFPENKLTIFNRWGDTVFEALNYQSDWDGTYRGKPLPAGTYLFVLVVRDGAERVVVRDTVTIVRE